LHERAITSLQEAIRAIEAGEIEARWRANKRATDIVTHLWGTLDVEKGGEIAANLDRLYPVMLDTLLQVDLRNDPAPARKVIELLEPLRASWYQVARDAESQRAPQPAQARQSADTDAPSFALPANGISA